MTYKLDRSIDGLFRGQWEILEELDDGTWNVLEGYTYSYCDQESCADQYANAVSDLEELEEAELGVAK